jgi:hypothetical protein
VWGNPDPTQPPYQQTRENGQNIKKTRGERDTLSVKGRGRTQREDMEDVEKEALRIGLLW